MLSDEHSCPVLAAALSKATLYLCKAWCNVRVCVQGCMCHPHSAPVKRKASPQRSLSQLHPTTWSQTMRLPITLCHFSYFYSRMDVLVESFTSELGVVSSTLSLFTVLQFSSRFATATTELARPNVSELSCEQLSHTEHVLQPIVGGIP